VRPRPWYTRRGGSRVEQLRHRCSAGTRQIDPCAAGGACRRPDNRAIHVATTGSNYQFTNPPGERGWDCVGVHVHAAVAGACDLFGQLRSRVRWTHGHDDVRLRAEVDQSRDLFETLYFRSLPGFPTSTLRGPQYAVTTALNRSTDAAAHRTGMK
jgi:hypothetical protein